YDVVLHVGCTCPSVVGAWQDWREGGFSLGRLRDELERAEGRLFAVRGVPNARVAGDVAARQRLESPGAALRAGELRALQAAAAAESIDPEDLWELGDRLGWAVEVSWSSAGDGSLDVWFWRADGAPVPRVERPIDVPAAVGAADA